MDKKTIQETIDNNKATFKFAHMIGIKCEGGVHVVKCDGNPKLVNTFVTIPTWKGYELPKPKEGIPVKALLQVRPSYSMND